ncbi:MAG TPA: phosphatase PAP2 family protein [Spirochaetota bacterium]|nr:phosphatase PAP2 family protein [Spirochaetota bacterium]
METFFADQLLFGEEILNRLHIFAGPLLDRLMVAITVMGNEIFYTLLIPLIYWCASKRIAILAGGSLLVGTVVNDALKGVWMNPRPDPAKLIPNIDELNRTHIPKNSPGFPSGHAQSAVAFWGALAWYVGRTPFVAPCVIIILLISYSRLYLGVHFLGDVLGGLAFGCVTLALYIVAVAWMRKKYELVNRYALIAAALIVPYLLFKILPGHEQAKTLGVLSGFLVGIILERGRVDFHPGGTLVKQLIMILAGLAGLFAIKAGLKPLLPGLDSADFLRYWLMGMWVTLVAPWIFVRFGIARQER